MKVFKQLLVFNQIFAGVPLLCCATFNFLTKIMSSLQTLTMSVNAECCGTRMFDSGVDMLSLHCGTMCLMMHTTVTQYDCSLSVSCILTLVKLEQSVLILTMCGRRRV